MQFNTNQFAVALLCSTFLLTGCLKNENGNQEPPSRENPEDPDENPGIENPEDSSPEDESPVDENPDEPEPQNPEPDGPVNGEIAKPYAEGIQVFKILDSSASETGIVRESRDLNGGSLTYNREKKTSSGGAWEKDSDGDWRILSDGISAIFLEVGPDSYSLNTAEYTLSINNTPYEAKLTHSYYDASGHPIKSFAETIVSATNLAGSLRESVTFDGSAYIYKERKSLSSGFMAYYEGPSDPSGTSCLDASGLQINETISTSGNCNIVSDSSGNAYGTLDSMISKDKASAPIVKPNTIFETELKIVADDNNFTTGELIEAGTGATMGRFSKQTFQDGTEYIRISGLNTSDFDFYNTDHIAWNDIESYNFVVDDQRIRMAVQIMDNTILKKNNFLINESGINQIDEAYIW